MAAGIGGLHRHRRLVPGGCSSAGRSVKSRRHAGDRVGAGSWQSRRACRSTCARTRRRFGGLRRRRSLPTARNYFASPSCFMKSWLSQKSHSWSIAPPFQWSSFDERALADASCPSNQRRTLAHPGGLHERTTYVMSSETEVSTTTEASFLMPPSAAPSASPSLVAAASTFSIEVRVQVTIWTLVPSPGFPLTS